jgi:serine phosphatase RsbU (regulator of sigma subunit)
MGLGGSVAEIATEQLQPGDRVLFFTDGVSEAKSAAGEEFGVPRLADLLVRATLDSVSPAETARRLSTSIVSFNNAGLNDDATLLLVDYHGNH